MEDNRDKLIPAQLAGYTWELSGYASKVPFANEDSLTMREVRNVFQLDPEPPQMELNDYICEAVRKRDLSYFSFFLHHFEKRLNGVSYRFLTRNGYDRYDPARFLDYKLEILQMLLFCLPRFDPEQETEFLKYAKNYIRNGLLFCRALEEAGSFGSIAEYQRVRHIGAIYTDSGKSRAEVVAKFAEKAGYKEDGATADELLTIARHNRSIVSLYRTEQDEDGEETGEDVTCDDSWDYADILWNGVRARAVKRAFWEMELREQRLLEGRNAICMACGRVSPMSKQKSFEELAVMFEGSGASGAERAYRRALDKLRLKLMESGIFDKVVKVANILGCAVCGALICSYVSFNWNVVMMREGVEVFNLQTGVFDAILPNMMPLLLTMGVYGLSKKGVKSSYITFGTMLLGFVLGLLGVIA